METRREEQQQQDTADLGGIILAGLPLMPLIHYTGKQMHVNIGPVSSVYELEIPQYRQTCAELQYVIKVLLSISAVCVLHLHCDWCAAAVISLLM